MIPASKIASPTPGQSIFGNSVEFTTYGSEIGDDDFVTCSVTCSTIASTNGWTDKPIYFYTFLDLIVRYIQLVRSVFTS